MAESAAKEAKIEKGASVPVTAPASAPATTGRDLFEDFWDDLARGLSHWPRFLSRRGLPGVPELQLPRLSHVDVYETGNDVVVKAEIPGIAKEEIEVVLNGSTLTIKGEKKEEHEVKRADYHRSERAFGTVSRTVSLPADVIADKAKAQLTDGVLEIRIPKTDEAKARSVKVKVD